VHSKYNPIVLSRSFSEVPYHGHIFAIIKIYVGYCWIQAISATRLPVKTSKKVPLIQNPVLYPAGQRVLSLRSEIGVTFADRGQWQCLQKSDFVAGLELPVLLKSHLCRDFAANRLRLFEEKIISHAGYEISDLFFWAVFLQILRINVIHQVNMAGQVFR
jgi:hypothetical protein